MRIVMFVFNDMTRDVRVQREAATLATAGHDVTVVARPRDVRSSVGDREESDGFTIERVPVPGAWRRPWSIAMLPARAWSAARRRLSRSRGASMPSTQLARPIDHLVKWRFAVLGWNRRAAAAAPAADAYHGHDLSGLAAAAAAAERLGVPLVYDSHELFVESGGNARLPQWAKARLGSLERRLSAGAVALVTVNDTLASRLGEELGIARRVVVHNAPARWSPPPDAYARSPLRAAVGGGSRPIVLYHGGFLRDRGLPQLAEAILDPRLADVRLAFLGFGPMAAELQGLAADPRFGGRVHVLPAVPPNELLSWVAGADVAAMVNQPASENERLSTPNKLFESLAAGVPIVSSDTAERRRILLDDPLGPLGVLCDPTRPEAIAAALASLIDQPEAARLDLRGRCSAAAWERWNWEHEGAKLVQLYATLGLSDASTGSTPATPGTPASPAA